jgi:hypothetical protein
VQWHINENRTYFPVTVTSTEGTTVDVTYETGGHHGY